MLAPYVTLIGLVTALFTGHKIKFKGKDMQCGKVNEMMDKLADSVECTKRKLAEEIK